MNQTITAVEGLRVGNARDAKEMTGVTVVLLEPPAVVAVDARGGYPTTFDTHGIEITKTYVERHAIFLAGGDVYGLDAPAGIWKYLIERGEASDQAGGQMPLVVGATIYDLWLAKMKDIDYHKIAYEACRNASRAPVAEGLVGAGVGAAAGNFRGHDWNTKSGLGSSAMSLPGGIKVGAIAVPNSHGNIYDFRTGRLIAGARDEAGKYVEFEDYIPTYIKGRPKKGHTTLGIVATNAELTHEELFKVSQIAHNGLAMAIRPVHTAEDGDTIFATSTARVQIRTERKRMVNSIAYLSSVCMATAIARAVTQAQFQLGKTV